MSACKKLYDYDWGCECEEEQQKVHLFEMELDDTVPQRRDMNIYDEAYEAMTKTGCRICFYMRTEIFRRRAYARTCMGNSK